MYNFLYLIDIIVLCLTLYLIFEIKNIHQKQSSINRLSPQQLIGIGGGGSNIVEYLVNAYPTKYDVLIVNSDKKALASKKVQNKILLEKLDGYGCGSNETCGLSLLMMK